jgi:hypothetical protein
LPSRRQYQYVFFKASSPSQRPLFDTNDSREIAAPCNGIGWVEFLRRYIALRIQIHGNSARFVSSATLRHGLSQRTIGEIKMGKAKQVKKKKKSK